ncbi:hypothetical protein AU476_25170 [Cupriavidus sp. UYMSc13B]|nr:hypothetical protein AU476_25170 [Cupriavidus sp. UYMSc13B]
MIVTAKHGANTKICFLVLGTYFGEVHAQRIRVDAVYVPDITSPNYVAAASRKLAAVQLEEVVEVHPVERTKILLHKRTTRYADEYRNRIVDPRRADQECVTPMREGIRHTALLCIPLTAV